MFEPTTRHTRSIGKALMAGAAVIALLATACGSSNGNKESEAGAPGVNAAAADAQITMSLTEFALSPSELQVPADQAFTVHVTNDGAAPHNFVIEAGGRRYETPMIDPAGTAMLEVPALKEGEYDMLCAVTGHDASGMTGVVVVGGEASGTSGASASHDGHDMSNLSVQEMLDMHEAGVNSFPAPTEGAGAVPLKPKMDGDVKVFELTAEQIQWEVEPGKLVPAMAYNGTVPGPELRVQDGDKVRIILHNEMPEPTTLHWHGLHVPNAMDGVPYITQDPVLEGESFTYEFTIDNDPGTYLYHSHFNSTAQVNAGLYGPIIVEPSAGGASGRYDEEYTILINDGPLGYTLNGKGFPATTPIVAKQGDEVLLHMANVGSALHPMHMHGFDFRVLAEDGKRLPNAYWANTLVVAPGKTYDVAVRTNAAGVWAFHCHILSHVEGPQGMFGMVTAVVVE